MNHPKITSPLLDDLKAKAGSLREQLKDIDLHIKDEVLRLVEELYGVKVGSIVKKGDGTEYLVTKIDTRWDSKPWVHGRRKLKNDDFHKVEHWIGSNWTVVAANPTAE